MPKKILSLGIMGGTFNPIHHGHLVTAEEALVQYELDRVIFIPSGHPPHKVDKEILAAEERYLMTVIATASNPDFSVSRIEIDRKGPSYAIDTVRELKKIYGAKTKIFFITGADAILEILTWKDSDKLYDQCSFIAATRPGYCLEKFKKLHLLPENEPVRGKRPTVFFMEIPALSISSTDIRQRIKESRPIQYLVPEGVANYIRKYGFYRAKNTGKR
jgi:nicotinate-nucleotide adenylyltransferase